jgi:hypothetical protein
MQHAKNSFVEKEPKEDRTPAQLSVSVPNFQFGNGECTSV